MPLVQPEWPEEQRAVLQDESGKEEREQEEQRGGRRAPFREGD
jgi:hypothetical protein